MWLKTIGPGLLARRMDLSANALSLEQLEEALPTAQPLRLPTSVTRVRPRRPAPAPR